MIISTKDAPAILAAMQDLAANVEKLERLIPHLSDEGARVCLGMFERLAKAARQRLEQGRKTN